MEVLRFDDAASFLERAMPLLAPDGDGEARHNLILGIGGTVSVHPQLYAVYRGWLAVEDDQPLAAATRTPPFNTVLADPVRAEALDAVVDAVHEDDPDTPGFVGNVPHVHRAAERWTWRTGATAEVEQRQGVYALVEMDDVPRPPGRARVATTEDRDLLVAWLHAFADEATGGPPGEPGLLERMLDARLAAEDAGYWLWEDGGQVVSTSGYGSPTPGGIRIGPVYTPPEHRRRGYGTIVVAELSRWLLARGHRACYLYTDLANPISNSIYGRIGYRRVCDSADVRFT
ncbi:MAG TPA: GNAT family N-acetyltransferase [Actinomycetota bacterium]|nr:GNAT family N-acetyltransferase [Actinomycetota bacterium]